MSSPPFSGSASPPPVWRPWPSPPAGPSTGITFRNTVTGEELNVSEGKEGGRDTPAVKEFFQTGKNLYIDDKSCLRNGESLFATSCSGCHGHLAEGKLGPGLNDNYWTYPSNTEDTGLFATIFGGANGMMGPHNENLTPDEMLQTIAWIRHLYTGPVKDARLAQRRAEEEIHALQAGRDLPQGRSGPVHTAGVAVLGSHVARGCLAR